nr:HAMP domain-containing sensor histidine kinase [uncultured Flavobacterium sp.]
MNKTLPIEEKKRLEVLKSYEILDTDPEIEYDDITFLASKICSSAIAAITLIDEDRAWVKSKVGFDQYDSSREYSFCSLSITKPSEIVNIPDLKKDEEFNALSQLNGFENGGFYASVILKDPTGFALGVLCVVDHVPKELNEEQLKSLKILGGQVCKLLELRKNNSTLTKNNQLLNLKYSELEHFARVVSHDIKSPLNNIISLINLLKENNAEKFDEVENEYLDYLTDSSYQLKNYVDGLLNYYRGDTINAANKEEIVVADVIQEIITTLDPQGECQFKIPDCSVKVKFNKSALEQILLNLISNGIKYNDKKPVCIEINCEESENHFSLSVRDNGNGIETDKLDTIFSFFTTLNKKDRFGNYGTGIGLATVKKITEHLNGKITVHSIPNQGSEFIITFEK